MSLSARLRAAIATERHFAATGATLLAAKDVTNALLDELDLVEGLAAATTPQEAPATPSTPDEPKRFGGHLGTCDALFGASSCTCDKATPSTLVLPGSPADTGPEGDAVRKVIRAEIARVASAAYWTTEDSMIERVAETFARAARA